MDGICVGAKNRRVRKEVDYVIYVGCGGVDTSVRDWWRKRPSPRRKPTNLERACGVRPDSLFPIKNGRQKAADGDGKDAEEGRRGRGDLRRIVGEMQADGRGEFEREIRGRSEEGN